MTSYFPSSPESSDDQLSGTVALAQFPQDETVVEEHSSIRILT